MKKKIKTHYSTNFYNIANKKRLYLELVFYVEGLKGFEVMQMTMSHILDYIRYILNC